jgi:plastocyanin
VRIGRQAQARFALAAMWLWVNCLAGAPPALSQSPPVTLRVNVRSGSSANETKAAGIVGDSSDVVVWLKPLDAAAVPAPVAAPPGKRPQVIQKNKTFHPHLTVVRVGSIVDFPNRDPFFHNVFSLFDGKRFDLGLYEAGATNSVRFDHVGVSYLFCNIHPEMSAVVVAVDTPYYGVSDKSGNVRIANVPDGKYELHVWYERSTADDLSTSTRAVTIEADSRDLGTVTVMQDPAFTPVHKNKYGQDYAPPPKEGYPQP